MKEDFRSTVQYYENLIENLMRENRKLKKESGIEFINTDFPEKI
jgi:hypothetical protein